jgi:hypothetical protein
VKFRNPATGETWSGRGRAPRWLDGKNPQISSSRGDLVMLAGVRCDRWQRNLKVQTGLKLALRADADPEKMSVVRCGICDHDQ